MCVCSWQFPTCPGLTDPGQNFGHGFYNDHHFHHGYHVYAAAVVAKYDAYWGRRYFEPVLALIRDVANPSSKDKVRVSESRSDELVVPRLTLVIPRLTLHQCTSLRSSQHFPMFRHKDWFLGSSWASGIGLINGSPYPNGRNQESSSEAIAAYEAMALYGDTMYNQWGGGQSVTTLNNANAQTAASVRDMSR